MKRPNEPENTLGVLRELPAEVSLDQVQHMVAAFPIAVGLTAWLALAKIHLNSIIMTTTGTLLVGTGVYFFSALSPAATPAAASTPEPAVVLEMPAAEVVLEEPAVVLELPPAKRAAPAPKPEPKTEIACTVLPTEDSTAQDDGAVAYAGAPAFPGTPSFPGVPPADPVASMDPLSPTQPRPAVNRQHSNERSFDLRDFTGITIASSVEVTVEIGEFSVSATGDVDMLNRLDVRNENGMLMVGYERIRGSYRNKGSVHLLIRMPRVDDLVVEGSGSINAERLVPTSNLDLKVLGSGNILLGRVDEVGKLHMSIEGSGGVHMATLTSSDVVNMTILGSGGVYLTNAVRVDEFHINMEGSGNVDCGKARVTGTTHINLIGSGNVQMGGETGRVDVVLEGSGDVNAMNLKARNGGTVNVLGSGNAHVYSDGKLELTTKGTGRIHTSGSAGLKGSRGVGSGAE